MINLLSPKTDIIETAWLFAASLTVKISYSTLKKEIEEHPFYPSLLSVSEVISSFGIKNVTARFDINKIPDIPTPFLFQLKRKEDKDSSFSVVKKSDGRTVEFFDPQSGKWRVQDKSEFIEQCTGIVLVAEVETNAGEPDYELRVAKEKKSLYFKCFAALILPAFLVAQGITGFVNNGVSAILPFFFSILFLAGSLITLLLIWHDVDRYSPVLQSICGISKKINCSAVLTSEGAKIFGISWSIVGFTYFAGGLIYILTQGFDKTAPLILLWQLNLIGSLYVFYSVYYQWKVAKNWCTLCLSVQFILILISTVGVLDGWYQSIDYSITSALKLFSALAIPFISSMLIYTLLVKLKEYESGKQELQRLKRNPDFLRRNLSEQKMITDNVNDLGILLGNRSSSNRIVKVCNPYCNPCAVIHDSVHDLLTASDDLCVQIIFMASTDSHDKRYFPVRHLLAVYENNEIDIDTALDDWYHSKSKDYDTFAAKYPIDEPLLSRQNDKIEAMRSWCEKTKIAFTPTFFVNGYQLPETNSISDFRYSFLS
jgi:uncharacterized membrane protein